MEMDKQKIFELRVRLIRALTSPQWDALSRVSGSVSLTGELLTFFEWLMDSGQAEWRGPGASPVPGQTGNIQVCIQNGVHDGADYGYAVETFARLLAFDSAQSHLLEPVYIAENNWASGEPNEPLMFVQYRHAIEFFDWLRGRADHFDKDRLVFLLSEKLEIIPSFEVSDLDEASFDGIDTLKELLAPDLHKEQRRAIAVKALVDMLSQLPTKERFPFLLRNLPQYVENVKNGYLLYAAEFSYEKIRNKVEEVRIDIASKINKTISDIQNQILAIPVATILVATQMKYGQENTLPNIALVIASIFFAGLMYLIIRNQKDTLKVLGSEISRQEKSLEKDYDKGAEQFKQAFAELRLRQQKQHKRLGALWGIVLLGLCLSTIAALWFSTHSTAPTTSNTNVLATTKSAPESKASSGAIPPVLVNPPKAGVAPSVPQGNAARTPPSHP